MTQIYCEYCAMQCYKDGLDVKEEYITKDPEKCSFKQEHPRYKEVKE